MTTTPPAPDPDDTPVVNLELSNAEVAWSIAGITLDKPHTRGWLLGFLFLSSLLVLFTFAVAWLFLNGVGIWGVNIPVAWGFAITNFVWWIGIGHAGTLISAILLLMRQDWRTSINRFTEAMTLFAVACAGLFPILHLGRPWFFYYLLPYPDTLGLWPQWRSPLVWDIFAVLTYFTVSLLFWFIGLIPDLASVRDRARTRTSRRIFGLLAMGWRGSARHWHRYETAYLLLAGLATPLVVSVHSIVSFDFTIAILPGWHSTIFPPYFVAGAIFSGFAMVLTLAIPIRKIYGLEDFITLKHLDNGAKIMLVTGLIVAYGYLMEGFMAWYSNDPYEEYLQINRILGPYAPAWWLLMICNVLVPQTLWFRQVRGSVIGLFVISLLINVGMWTERFVIVVASLHRDFLPSSWGMFYPTLWDIITLLGSIGLFVWLFFLFIRYLPMISIHEMQNLLALKRGEKGPSVPGKGGMP